MQGLMFWFRSVKPSLHEWCKILGILEPSIFGFQGHSPLSECDFCSIQNIEGYKIQNFIDQTNRVGQTDHTHTINPCIGCSSD